MGKAFQNNRFKPLRIKRLFCLAGYAVASKQARQYKITRKEIKTMTTYTTPDNAEINNISLNIARQTHTLIGGATRSGKSVLLNTFITDMIKYNLPVLKDSNENADRQCSFILIDPKRGVEMGRYKNLPHTIAFATDAVSAVDALQTAVDLMNRRYDELNASGQRKYNGKHVYVIVDEMADISGNKAVSALIDRIARLGGAANIHLILATQQPLITSGAIASSTKANMTCQIALRCEESKDSRAIIRQAGAETLPLNGFCLFRSPYDADIKRLAVPFTTDEEIDSVIKFWEMQKQTSSQPERKREVVTSNVYQMPKMGFVKRMIYAFTGIY